MDWRLITRRLFLLLAGALFAKFRLGRTASEFDNGILSASQILERMANTYRKCNTYQDSGCVTTIFVYPHEQHTRKKPFSTVFVRPTRFRFEFKSSHNNQIWHRYIVWADGPDVRTWWDIRPEVSQEASLSMGLAGATGVSGGSARTVPALLMPDSIGGMYLTDLTQLTRLEDAAFAGINCFRVQGTYEVDAEEWERFRQMVIKSYGKDPGMSVYGPQTLWIDKSTFLLRRIDELTQFDDYYTECTTTYEPALDGAIADSQLRFDPPDKSKPPGIPIEPETHLEVGAAVLARWHGTWWRAQVIGLERDGRVHIHYVGWDSSWDETLSRSELQMDISGSVKD